MKLINKISILLISILLVACSTNFFNVDNTSKILEANEKDLLTVIRYGEDSACYTQYQNGFEYENVSLPEKYDLRDLGLVTSVKNQGQVGTCWTFALMSCAETYVLNQLGLTVDEYIEKYGSEPDFCEKAFAYYSVIGEPDSVEGFVGDFSTEQNIYNCGGNNSVAIASLAREIGFYDESLYPYTNEKGRVDYLSTWTLDEIHRYENTYSLIEFNNLPCPASRDDDGNYVFNEEALTQIKKELLNNNEVIISYCADNTVAPYTYEQLYDDLHDLLVVDHGVSEEYALYYIDFRYGLVNTDELSREEVIDLIKFRLMINDLDENMYDFEGVSDDDLRCLLNSDVIGDASIEDIIYYENNRVYYINVDGDNPTYAHYTYDETLANHMVCIVGYDDDYSASNFIEGHQPPHDGAFICKNSWDDDWGNDGYFYLSYYDHSLTEPAIVSLKEDVNNLRALSNDDSAYVDAVSTLFDNKVSQANIFKVEDDCTLYEVGTLTDNQNTNVNYEVYLLNDNYTSPTDGTLIGELNADYYYLGFHRSELDNPVSIAKGSTISVVTTQKVKDQYVFVNTFGYSYEFIEVLFSDTLELEHDTDKDPVKYHQTVVEEGTSLYCIDDKWSDYNDILAKYDESDLLKYINSDNFPIKAYIGD